MEGGRARDLDAEGRHVGSLERGPGLRAVAAGPGRDRDEDHAVRDALALEVADRLDEVIGSRSPRTPATWTAVVVFPTPPIYADLLRTTGRIHSTSGLR